MIKRESTMRLSKQQQHERLPSKQLDVGNERGKVDTSVIANIGKLSHTGP